MMSIKRYTDYIILGNSTVNLNILPGNVEGSLPSPYHCWRDFIQVQMHYLALPIVVKLINTIGRCLSSVWDRPDWKLQWSCQIFNSQVLAVFTRLSKVWLCKTTTRGIGDHAWRQCAHWSPRKPLWLHTQPGFYVTVEIPGNTKGTSTWPHWHDSKNMAFSRDN